MKPYLILAMNFGSTSTKVAVFENERPLIHHTFRHPAEDTQIHAGVAANAAFRQRFILDFLAENNIALDCFDAVVSRGGLVRPVAGGVYLVNEAMLDDLRACRYGAHACNVGAIIAHEIAAAINRPAYIADPGVTDELCDLARLSGHPAIRRRSVFHALNQKAMARRYAAERGLKYEEINLIVAHLGGGATIGAHQRGRVIDVNNGTDGEGPYTAERSGGLPVSEVLRLLESGELGVFSELRNTLLTKSGLVAYLGTNDGRVVSERVRQGDAEAELVYRGMAYQISKEIGAMAAVLAGQVEAIIVTGGLAHDELLTGWIAEQVRFIAPVVVYAGEDELTALTLSTLAVLRGEAAAQTY